MPVRPQKITFGQMRANGIGGAQIYAILRPAPTSVIQPPARRFVGPSRDREAPSSGDTFVGTDDDRMSRAVVMHRSGVRGSAQRDQKAYCRSVTHRICSNAL